jgi:NarL family two-component system sensor histidine kinase LiaS
VQSAVQEAWTGEQVSQRLAGSLPSGRVAAAGPIIAYNGRVIGIVVGVFLPLPPATTAHIAQTSQQQAVETALAQIAPGMLLFILGASVLGILTGVLFSHSLTRRLKRITGAAHDWSQGNLEVAVVDHSHDEIGELAQDLNHMAGQLQQLVSARQELAVMEERHRLAQDLHDSIKQQLFVMTMLVGAARASLQAQPEVKATLSEVEALATEAHQELTALIRALRPAAFSRGRSLGVALRDLVLSWSQSTGISADIRIDEDLSTSPDVEQAIFRVAQEAIANIARHSGASTLTIEAEIQGDKLLVAVTDDGHGFDAVRPEGWGLGILGMRERLESVRGQLTISSGPQGSRIEAQCPVAAEVSI